MAVRGAARDVREAAHLAGPEAAENGESEAKMSGNKKEEKSTVEKVLTSSTARSIGNTVVRELTRGLLGVLGIKSRR